MDEIPEHIRQSLGELILFALAKADDPEQGWFFAVPNISVGVKPRDVPLGAWRIEVKRTTKP